MSIKKLFSSHSTYDTLIGSNATLEGDLIADGNVRIDGKIKGNVKINGNLVMGETALIIGNVSAGNIDLAGTIEGNVYCKDQLKLASTAKLIGDIQVKGLSIEEGGQFHGICSMSTFENVKKNTSNLILNSNDIKKHLKKKPIISQPQEIKDSTNL